MRGFVLGLLVGYSIVVTGVACAGVNRRDEEKEELENLKASMENKEVE